MLFVHILSALAVFALVYAVIGPRLYDNSILILLCSITVSAWVLWFLASRHNLFRHLFLNPLPVKTMLSKGEALDVIANFLRTNICSGEHWQVRLFDVERGRLEYGLRWQRGITKLRYNYFGQTERCSEDLFRQVVLSIHVTEPVPGRSVVHLSWHVNADGGCQECNSVVAQVTKSLFVELKGKPAFYIPDSAIVPAPPWSLITLSFIFVLVLLWQGQHLSSQTVALQKDIGSPPQGVLEREQQRMLSEVDAWDLFQERTSANE